MQQTYPIIDIHCHTAGIGACGSGCFVSRALRRNVRFGFFLRTFGVSERELHRHGDRLVLQRLAGHWLHREPAARQRDLVHHLGHGRRRGRVGITRRYGRGSVRHRTHLL